MLNLFTKNLLVLFLIFFIVSCSANAPKEVQTKKIISLEKLYKAAYENFENGKYKESLTLFEKVESDYSYTEWAAKSLLMRSYIYYESGKYVNALTNLKKFQSRYTGSKEIPYVEYLTAMCIFEQVNFVSLSQENTNLALEQFKKIIKNYPNSSFAEDSKFKIDLLLEQLAGKEMYIARYYIERSKWIPALYRLNNIVTNYQTTIYIEEALHRLVEINYKIGNIDSAKNYAAILGYNYNDSDWYKKSYKIVEGKNFQIESNKQNKSFKDKLLQLIKIK